MSAQSPEEVTQLLLAWNGGDTAALDKLMPLVYDELRKAAKRYMRREAVGHTLQTAALVNEVYLRLIDAKNVRWQDRAHFLAISARLMRRVLVDFARRRRQFKRGGEANQISIEEAMAFGREQSADVVALDDALTELTRLNPRQSQGVERRFFGGPAGGEGTATFKMFSAPEAKRW